MEKLRDFISIALIVTLTGLSLLLNCSCKTVGVAATPPPIPTCVELAKAHYTENLKDGFVLLDTVNGSDGGYGEIYVRPSDNVKRGEVYTPVTTPEPAKSLNFTLSGNCTAPKGTLYKTYRAEAVVGGGKGA